MARLWRDQGKVLEERTGYSGLRVVYGGVRHARSEGSEGVVGGVGGVSLSETAKFGEADLISHERTSRMGLARRRQRPPHRRPTIDYERDRRGVYSPRRQRRPLGYISAFIVVAGLAVIVLMFAWRAVLMGFVLVGVTAPSTAAAVIVVLVILGAAALRERLSGRPF
jgi:hypothetical protein